MMNLINNEICKRYRIIYEESFISDLNEVTDYITFVLYNPQASERLLKKIYKMIDNLQYFPTLFKQYKETCYRRIVVNNFLIFYLIDESNQRIHILHFYYGHKKMFNL